MPLLEECYAVLGLRPYTGKAAVLEKYRLLVQVWHPDRFEQQRRIREQAEEHLKEITAAYKQIESAGFPEAAASEAATREVCRCPWCGIQNRLPAGYRAQEVRCGGCKRTFRYDGSSEPARTARRQNARSQPANSSTPSLVKCPSCAAPNWCVPEEMVRCGTCGTFFSWN